MTETSVVTGPGSFDLANNIARRLGAQLAVASLRIFSDGESSIKLGSVGKNCVIIQSTNPPTDTHLIQLLMMAKKCTDDGARDISAVIPYLGYARQDRAFMEGEVVSISLVAKLFESVGLKHIITVDIHSQLAMSYFASIQNVSSIPLLADYASKMKLSDPIAVSPDAGGTGRAKEFARHLDIDVLVLKKSRHRVTGDVTVDESLDMDIYNRDAIVIDDIISSGDSLVKAAEVLQKKGVRKIYAMATHALLVRDADEKIKSAGVEDIISTNSVPSQYSKVDLSPEIALALKSRY
ncbi:MAG: ribose-phosphate pyrophosphokinase [Thermoproteota archaeon]|nr:ribose-phosphate pyrophosphokinase [Thermoproteota archaeon]MDQ3888817.1 ribose-phosphate pyrophosphokinase [Thermoproteota archaeon]